MHLFMVICLLFFAILTFNRTHLFLPPLFSFLFDPLTPLSALFEALISYLTGYLWPLSDTLKSCAAV